MRSFSLIMQCACVMVIMISCQPDSTEDPDESPILGEWTMLTKLEEWTVFNPCDAENQRLSISKGDGSLELVHLEGHEATRYAVHTYSITPNGHELILTPSWSEEDTVILSIHLVDAHTVELKWNDRSMDGALRFCDAQTLKSYPIVDQPCNECWEEQDCDPALKDSSSILYSVKIFHEEIAKSVDTMIDLEYLEDHQYKVVSYNYPSFEVRFEMDTMLMLILGEHTLEFVKTKFREKNHSLTFYEDRPEELYGIDGEEFYGTDHGIPDYEIKSILYEAVERLEFPKSEFSDLYNPNLLASHVSAYETDGGEVIITMLNSDGAGTYFVTWVLNENNIERFVQFGI